MKEASQSLLNEVKYSNEEKMNEVVKRELESQSLLNEVKYSNPSAPIASYGRT